MDVSSNHNDFQKRRSAGEVRVSGRRTHLRMRVESPWSGAMRVSRDVSVDEAGGQSLAVLSTAPGIVDEELTLEMVSGEETAHLRVKVVESRPVVVEGCVRHRLQLLILPVSAIE